MVLSTVKHTAFTILGAIALFSKEQLYFTSQWLTQEQEELPAVANRKKSRTQQNFMTEDMVYLYIAWICVMMCWTFSPYCFPLNFFLDMHVPDWPLLCNTEFQTVFCPAEAPHYATSSAERQATRKINSLLYSHDFTVKVHLTLPTFLISHTYRPTIKH